MILWHIEIIGWVVILLWVFNQTVETTLTKFTDALNVSDALVVYVCVF